MLLGNISELGLFFSHLHADPSILSLRFQYTKIFLKKSSGDVLCEVLNGYW